MLHLGTSVWEPFTSSASIQLAMKCADRVAFTSLHPKPTPYRLNILKVMFRDGSYQSKTSVERKIPLGDMVRHVGFKTLQIVKWVMLMWSQISKHTPTWRNDISCIKWKGKKTIWLQELWRDVCMGNSSSYRAGKLHFSYCLPPFCVHILPNQIFSLGWGLWFRGNGGLGEGEHTHWGRKLWLGKSFSRIVNVLHRK